MADYTWHSDEEKFEAIGFLAIPNVIRAIEVQVPANLKEKFEKEYDGCYSNEYPYVTKANSKYSYQFRIYLNDTDGCPEAIEGLLDDKYGNRINNSDFIKELVKNYGFRFTNGPQNTEYIKSRVFSLVGRPLFDSFRQGLFSNGNFLKSLDSMFEAGHSLAEPNVLGYEGQRIGKRLEKRSVHLEDISRSMTPNQMLQLGWDGERYIAHLLDKHDKTFLEAIGLDGELEYTYEWFNDGYQKADEETKSLLGTDRDCFTYECVKKWEDQSVGKGCDIRVTLDSGEKVDIEVKTSRSTYPFFKMTSIEMQDMEKLGNNYVLIKINNFGKLLKGDSPDIIAIVNPFEKLFHPKHMKDATFLVGGK